MMVSDVRFKVRTRLRGLITGLADMYTRDAAKRERVEAAQENPRIAAEVRAVWRSTVVRSFPGCVVGFTTLRISIHLPDGYPASTVPITEAYPVYLRGAFFPAAAPEIEKGF